MSETNTNPGQIDPYLLNGVSFAGSQIYVVKSAFHSGTTTSVPVVGNVYPTSNTSKNFQSPANPASPVMLQVNDGHYVFSPSAVLISAIQANGADVDGVFNQVMHIVGWNADEILLSGGDNGVYNQGIIIGNANLAADIAKLEQSSGSLVFSQNGAVPVPTIDTGVLSLTVTSPTITCFAEGTRIATPAGDVAIEDLAEGDMVTTLSGLARPVLWIGRRSFDCAAAHPQPARVAPVEIEAGAFGPGLPARPLVLSPEHALFLDGAMVPVHCLINGTTIRQLTEASVTYYHIELPRHDVVLAEGLAAETYLDTGSRQSLIRREAAIAQAA